MAANQDFEDLKAEYARWSNESLLRVVHAPDEYRPAAVQAANAVLAQRNPAEVAALTPSIVQTLDEEYERRQEIADAPLGTGAKALCFIFCGIPGIVFAAIQEAKGRSRRADTAWRWVMYGWLVRMLLAALGFGLFRLV